jgi:hypothetical protein
MVRIQLALIDILTTGTYDLQIHSDFIKSIREGYFSYREVKEISDSNESAMKVKLETTILRSKPDEPFIYSLLISCFEDFYKGIV